MEKDGIRIVEKRFLNGPNLFALFPVMEIELDLGKYRDTASNGRIKDILEDNLLDLRYHSCSLGHEGGFLERVEQGTYPAHVIEHLSLAIQNMAGDCVSFGKSYSSDNGNYKLIIEFGNMELATYSIESAVNLYEKLLDGDYEIEQDVQNILQESETIFEKAKLGPSTESIIKAAKRKDIPYRHLHGDYSLFSLGWGKNKKKIWGPVSSQTSLVASDIAKDKILTKKILSEAGFTVPRGRTIQSEDEAVEFADEIGYPVIIKPVRGHHGEGVVGDLRNAREIREAYKISKEFSEELMVEEYIQGEDYRFLVLNHKVIAVARRVPANVVGNGKSTIKELVEKKNSDPRRGEGHLSVLTKIDLGKAEKRFLKNQGLSIESIPRDGEQIFLRVGGNLSTGGTSENYMDRVHPSFKKVIERASMIIGLDIMGIDIVSNDITTEPLNSRWGIIEVNASPGLRMHTDPFIGTPIDVGEEIIQYLYPDGDGRIPLVAVTGTNGKTTTSRIIEWIARHSGYNPGMTVTGGIYIKGEQILEGDTTGPWSANVVLDNPEVDFAVLETARGGILREGLGFDKCFISVITNIREDHLGIDGIQDVEDIFWIKSILFEVTDRDGYCVFNGNDEFAERLMKRCNGTPIIFALEKDDFVTSCIEQGRFVFLSEGHNIVVYREGNGEVIVDINEIPFLLGGAVMLLENTLAAVAASYSAGIPISNIVDNLKTFSMDEEINPGRANTFELGGSLIILDYAHNKDGIRAIGEYASHLPGNRTMVTFTVPGDRDDEFIKKCGKEAAKWFDMIVCTENQKIMRGRKDGEICNLIANGVLNNGGKVPISIPNMEEAISFVINNLAEGDRLVIADLDITSKELKELLDGSKKSHLLRKFDYQKYKDN